VPVPAPVDEKEDQAATKKTERIAALKAKIAAENAKKTAIENATEDDDDDEVKALEDELAAAKRETGKELKKQIVVAVEVALMCYNVPEQGTCGKKGMCDKHLHNVEKKIGIDYVQAVNVEYKTQVLAAAKKAAATKKVAAAAAAAKKVAAAAAAKKVAAAAAAKKAAEVETNTAPPAPDEKWDGYDHDARQPHPQYPGEYQQYYLSPRQQYLQQYLPRYAQQLGQQQFVYQHVQQPPQQYEQWTQQQFEPAQSSTDM
jgi:hypothetical protein